MEQLLDPWYAALIVTLLAMGALGAYAVLDRIIRWLRS